MSATSAANQPLLGALPSEVIKRDGHAAPFDLAKIRKAIAAAGAASGEFEAGEAARLTATVGKVLAHRFSGETPTIEAIPRE